MLIGTGVLIQNICYNIHFSKVHESLKKKFSVVSG